eukprot:3145875-Prymnesium_polylepis.1
MSGWDNLEGTNKRTSACVVENAKLRHPGHLGLDHVARRPRGTAFSTPTRFPSRDTRVMLECALL